MGSRRPAPRALRAFPLAGAVAEAATPALTVSDMTRACAYYQTLGLEPVGTVRPDAALVQGHGLAVLLQQGDRDQDPADPGRPDAVVLLDQPGRLYRILDDRCADLRSLQELGAQWSGYFGVRDCDGNTLGIGPARRPGAAARRRAWEIADSTRIRMREHRRARFEQRHIEEFRRFYEGLSNTENIYYMFFSEGLLHWVAKALSYVPEHVNLVLLGSDLPPEEAAWARQRSGRPFHNIALRVDDATAWEFLFTVNTRSFGWLDTDCLVLNPALFEELAKIAPDSAANCAWAWDSGHGFPLANTFFLFINVAAIAALRERNLAVSPSCYYYDWASLHVPGRSCYGRRPRRAQLSKLREILPEDSQGRPATPYGMPYFDTTVMYQLLARACGYKIHRVRDLEGFGHLRNRAVQDESTDELLHVGGVSKADALDEFSRYFHNQQIRLLYLAAEYIVLDGASRRLPPSYSTRLTRTIAALAQCGLTPDDAGATLRQYLSEVREMSDSAVNAVLRRPDGEV